MAQATVRISIWTGATAGLGTDAETGIVMGKSDALDSSAAPVTIPTAAGTNFSWYKNLGLECTANPGNAIDNRRVRFVEIVDGGAANLPTGLRYFFNAQAAYAQSAAPAADAGTNGATPAGYTAMSAAEQVYDATAVTTVADGSVNGTYLRTAVGVDNTYVSGPGQIIGPDLRCVYDEA